MQLRFVVIPVAAVSRRRIGMDTKVKVISIAMMMKIRFRYPKGSQLLLVAAVCATLMLLLAICAICRPAKLVRPASNLHPAPSSQERGARYSESSPSSRFATPSSFHTNSKGESRILRAVPVGRPPSTQKPHIVRRPPAPSPSFY